MVAGKTSSSDRLAGVEVGKLGREHQAEQTQGAATFVTAHFRLRSGPVGNVPEQLADQPVVRCNQATHGFDRLLAAGAEEAVVPHLLKTSGQDLLQKPADELS